MTKFVFLSTFVVAILQCSGEFEVQFQYENATYCLGAAHTNDAVEWYSFNETHPESFHNEAIEHFHEQMEDRLTVFALTNGSQALIGFLLDAITSESGSSGAVHYDMNCFSENWKGKTLGDIVVVEDGPGSAQSLTNVGNMHISNGVGRGGIDELRCDGFELCPRGLHSNTTRRLTWYDSWEMGTTAGLVVDPLGGIVECRTTTAPASVNRTIALLQAAGANHTGMIATNTPSEDTPGYLPVTFTPSSTCELSRVPAPTPTDVPSPTPTSSPTTSEPSSSPTGSEAATTSRVTTVEPTGKPTAPAYSINFISAVPRVVPIEGGTVRISIENLEPGFKLQLVGSDDPVDYDMSEKCDEKICARPDCTCLQFTAPSLNTSLPNFVDRAPLVLTATNPDGVFRTSDSVFLRYASTFRCVSDRWSPDGGSLDECDGCPSGGYCPGGNRVWPQKGYWSKSEHDVPIPCPNRDACPGVSLSQVHQRSPNQQQRSSSRRRRAKPTHATSVGLLQVGATIGSIDTEVGADQCIEFADENCDGVTIPCLCRVVNTETCEAGYAGVACSSCAAGWYSNGVANLRCIQCPDPAVQRAEVAWLGACMATFLLMLAAAIVTLGNRELGTFVSLLIGLQQFFLLSSSSSELLNVPESMRKWFGYFSLVNLQVEFFKPGCSNAYDWVDLLWMQLGVVAGAIVMFIVAASIRPWFQRFKDEHRLSQRLASYLCVCTRKQRTAHDTLSSSPQSDCGSVVFKNGQGFGDPKPSLKHQGTFRDVTTARRFNKLRNVGRSLRDIVVAPGRATSPVVAHEPQRTRSPMAKRCVAGGGAAEKEFDEEESITSDIESATSSMESPPEKEPNETLTKSKVAFDVTKQGQDGQLTKLQTIQPRISGSAPVEKNVASAGAIFRHRTVHSLVILASILYLQLITRAFQGIDCHMPAGFDHQVLYIEQDMECFSPAHYMAMLFVVPVILFSVCFPLWVLWILNRTRTQGVTIARNEQFGFLFRGLKFSGFNVFFRWTVLPLSLVIALQSTFLRDAPLRILVASLVFIFNFGIVASFWPFADWYNNAVQLAIGFAAIVELLVLLADSGIESLQCHIDVTRDPAPNAGESTKAVEAESVCDSTSEELLIVSVLLVVVLFAAIVFNVRRKIYTGSFFPAYIPPDAVAAASKKKGAKSPWDALSTAGGGSKGTRGRGASRSARARSLLSKMKGAKGEGNRGVGLGAAGARGRGGRGNLPAPVVSMLSLSNLSLDEANTMRRGETGPRNVRSMSVSVSSTVFPFDAHRTHTIRSQASVFSLSDLDTLRRTHANVGRPVSPSLSARSVVPPEIEVEVDDDARRKSSPLSPTARHSLSPHFAADIGGALGRMGRRASAPDDDELMRARMASPPRTLRASRSHRRSRSPSRSASKSRSFGFDEKAIADLEKERCSVPI